MHSVIKIFRYYHSIITKTLIEYQNIDNQTNDILSCPAISINENQSLIAINIINNNPLIIIDWFNQSIKIDTHSPNRLNCY